MRICQGLFFILGVLVVAAAADANKRDAALDRLQGDYTLTSAIEEGQPDTDLPQSDSWRISIRSNVLEMTNAVYKRSGFKWSFHLDPNVQPAGFDVTPVEGPDKGKTMLGIYKFENHELTIVMGDEHDRPSSFAAGKKRLKLVLAKKPSH